MRYLILDTSFLMALAELRSVSLSELAKLYPRADLVTTKSVIRELKSFLRRRRRVSAGVALEVVRRRGIRVMEEYDGEADDDVLALARALDGVVVTLDLELKGRALDEGIPAIYLRAGKRLVLDDPLRLSKEG